MFTKKNVQENALLDVSDEELAQFSGGGLLDAVPLVGPALGSTLNGTKVRAGLDLTTPIANAGLGVETNPGLGIGGL